MPEPDSDTPHTTSLMQHVIDGIPPDRFQITNMGDILEQAAQVFASIYPLVELVAPRTFGIEEEDKRIAQARTDSIKEFRDIGLLFKTAVEEAGNLSQTGVEAAKEYVDIFHQVVAQTIDEEDLKDLTDCLGHSTQILLESANSMHEKLKNVRLRLGVLLQTQIDESKRIKRGNVRLKEDIEGHKAIGNASAVIAGICAVGGLVVPPLFVPAAILAVNTGICAAIVSDQKKSASFKDNSLDSLKAFFTVVEMAERITTGHVNYWESARKNLDKVSKTSHLWLKKPSSKVLARKLSEQWEETRQSYEDCYSKTSETSRRMEFALQITIV